MQRKVSMHEKFLMRYPIVNESGSVVEVFAHRPRRTAESGSVVEFWCIDPDERRKVVP